MTLFTPVTSTLLGTPGSPGSSRVPAAQASKEDHMEIWINPDCSKCRSALSVLDAEQADYTVRRYLEDPPNELELREVLTRLGLEPWDIARTGEPTAAGSAWTAGPAPPRTATAGSGRWPPTQF